MIRDHALKPLRMKMRGNLGVCIYAMLYLFESHLNSCERLSSVLWNRQRVEESLAALFRSDIVNQRFQPLLNLLKTCTHTSMSQEIIKEI